MMLACALVLCIVYGAAMVGNAWYVVFDSFKVVTAGEYFFPSIQEVGKFQTAEFAVRIDTNTHVCIICNPEEVRACIRWDAETKMVCNPETTQNTITQNSDELAKFNVSSGQYSLGFQCMNEKDDCDVRILVEVQVTDIPTPNPTKSPTYDPTKAPSLLPTNQPSSAPTLRPTRGPRKLPEALKCTNGTRQRAFIPEDSWVVCGCDMNRIDHVCHFCCLCSTIKNCEANQYDDLLSLPIYFGHWRLAKSGEGGEGNYLTAITKRGLEIPYGVDFQRELSAILLKSSFGTDEPIGFWHGYSAPIWMIEKLEDVGFTGLEIFSTTSQVSRDLGLSATQPEYIRFDQEGSCSHTCQNVNGPIQIWQWIVTDYEERFVIHHCQFRCSDEHTPLCPPWRCRVDDPNCQCCKEGTFRNEIIDSIASSVNYTSFPDDPYHWMVPQSSNYVSVTGVIVLAILVAIVLCCFGWKYFSKKRKVLFFPSWREVELRRRAKIMVLGESDAGKTATVHSLLGCSPFTKHKPTVGIKVKVARTKNWSEIVFLNPLTNLIYGGKFCRKSRQKQSSDQIAPFQEDPSQSNLERGNQSPGIDTDIGLSIWDCGKQGVLDVLYRAFFSREGIYLVVFDMTKLLERDEESIKVVKEWLSYIKLQTSKAGIILVGTRADIVNKPSELQQINEVINNHVGSLVNCVVNNDEQGYLYFPLDNTSSDVNRASKLRREIENSAMELHKTLIDLKWLHTLDNLICLGRQYTSKEKVFQVAFKNGLTGESIEEMLNSFHKLGMLVYEQETKLIVLDPQWLLDKLSSAMNNEGNYFNFRRSELDKYRQTGIASKKLLKRIWSEKVNFLIDFMKCTMLMSEIRWGKENTMYFVASLIAQEKLESFDCDKFEGGMKCMLDFSASFLPKDLFLRIITDCVMAGNSRQPKLSREEALVYLNGEEVALVEDEDKILIYLKRDAKDGLKILQSIILIVRGQKNQSMPNLEWTLFVQSPGSNEIMDYAALRRNRERGRKDSQFEVYFSESVEPLDRDFVKLLEHGLTYHVFISYKQETATDMAALLHTKLRDLGIRAWYDQELAGNLSDNEMREGIQNSKCFLLLLTKNVFQSTAVKRELRTALENNKPVLLVHESQENLAGYSPISEYQKECPEELRHIFASCESMPFQRRAYLAVTFILELVCRINSA